MITITYEDGRVVQLPDPGSSLLHLAGTGALDVLIDAVESLRQDPKEDQ